MKKLLSIVLAAAMLLTLAVLPASAAGPATVVYKADGVQVGAVVDALTGGNTYVPDRMAPAKEGYYFAGWKNAAGKYVDTDVKDGKTFIDKGFVLADGENVLTAEYKAYPDKVSGLKISGSKVVAATTDADGLNYKNILRTGNGYHPVVNENLDGEKVQKIYNNNPHNVTGGFALLNADGSAVQLKPSTQYTLTITYKVPALVKALSYQFGVGIKPECRTVGKDNQFCLKPFNFTDSTDATDVESSTQWFLCDWQKARKIEGASETWQTLNLNITTSASSKYVGTAPVVAGMIRIPGGNNQNVYFKDITIKDAAYVEPVDINYVVNGETVKTVKAKPGTVYELDRTTLNQKAPAGKFFAGWKDSDGKFVIDKMTVKDGVNTLTACFKDKVGRETVVASIDPATLCTDSAGKKRIVIPTDNGKSADPVKDGYLAWLNQGGYSNDKYISDTEKYMHHYNTESYTRNTYQFIHDSEGVPFMAKPDTCYEIKMTLRVPRNEITDTKAAYEANPTKDNRAGFFMYVDVGMTPSNRNSDSWYKGNVNTAYDKKAWLKATNNETIEYDHGPGYPFWSDVDLTQWTDVTFNIITHSEQFYNENGIVPTFSYYVKHSGNRTELDVKNIEIRELRTNGYYKDTTVAGETVPALKIANKVEDSATYEIEIGVDVPGKAGPKDPDIWQNFAFMTADANDAVLNQGYVGKANHIVYKKSDTFQAIYVFKVLVTTEIVGNGDSLYMYLPGGFTANSIDLLSITKVDAIKNGGVSMLKDQPADADQALRFYFNYKTVSGEKEGQVAVVNGKEYTVKSRGFLFANAANTTKVNREVAKDNKAIIDFNTTDFTKCWDNSASTLTFSTFVKGFKAENGQYNNSQKLYVRGYIVLDVDGKEMTVYSKPTAYTVKEVADLGAVK